MSDLQRFTRYGECKKGVHHKYYEVEAEELEDGGSARWTFRWARIGRECKKPKTGVVYSFDRAKQICEEQFAHKEAKSGYKEVTPLEALASCVQDVTDREDVNGLPKIELDIPNFHAGSSEKRMQEFCKSYNVRLNVIRASYHDLARDKYRKQIEDLLDSFQKQYKRMKRTKAHGRNLGDEAFEAKIAFFNALRGNAGCRVMIW